MAEENVGVGTTQTEAVAGATTGGDTAPNRENSTVLGKFKSVDALARAYEALQAEFTRRSQRLRQLERETEKFQKQAESSGVEKLRKAAKLKREEAKAFDEFTSEMESYRGEGNSSLERTVSVVEEALKMDEAEASEEGEVAEIQADEGRGADVPTTSFVEERTGDDAENAEIPSDGERTSKELLEEREKGAQFRAAEGESATDSEGLYRQAVNDEGVRLRIVGEYLASLGKAGAPVTGKGVGVTTTPPVKATTLGQAGNMALLYFRKPPEA